MELLPFTCRSCGKSFCAEHRLPENHDCPMTKIKIIPMRKVKDGDLEPVYVKRSHFRTSRTELLHLTVGIFIFFIIEAALFFRFELNFLISITGIIALAFIIHELAHKFVAQYYGLWSEFRLDPFGILISLVTVFLPLKLIAPGAVIISGSGITIEKKGKIALAGPLVNIIQVLVFSFISKSFPFFGLASILNSDLAIFNLIPLSVLDGRKVYEWNKVVWAVAFLIAIILWVF